MDAQRRTVDGRASGDHPTRQDIIFQRRLNWETILQTDAASFLREAFTEEGEIIYGKPGYLGCVAGQIHGKVPQ